MSYVDAEKFLKKDGSYSNIDDRCNSNNNSMQYAI